LTSVPNVTPSSARDDLSRNLVLGKNHIIN